MPRIQNLEFRTSALQNIKFTILAFQNLATRTLCYNSMKITLIVAISYYMGNPAVYWTAKKVVLFWLFKVPLTPKILFLLKKSASFPDFISEKIISIDKILAFLQAFEHIISMFTTAQSGIWVGLLVMSLREPSWNTHETFDWA